MSSLVVAQAKRLADTFSIAGDGTELVAVLKATAFKGQVSDAQMTALLVVARHVRVSVSGCWEWVGALSRGYGQLTHKGKHQTAHRFSFEQLVEPIKDGMWVLHHCDNRCCVNPQHLYQGTPIDNRADMISRSRWEHPWASRESCARGHNYEQEGFRMASDGSRVCKACMREHMRAFRAKQKDTNQ